MPVWGALVGAGLQLAKRAVTGGTAQKMVSAGFGIGRSIAPAVLGGVGYSVASRFGRRNPRRRRRGKMSIEKLMIIKSLGGSRSMGFQLGLMKLFK